MLKHPFLKTYVWESQEVKILLLAGRLAQLAIEELMCRDRKRLSALLPSAYHMGVQADEDDAQRALTFIKPDESAS